MTALHRALAVVMLLSACTPRDARFNPSHFTLNGAGAPPDVVLPVGTRPGGSFGGLNILEPEQDGFCCAAGPHVDLPVRKDGPADVLIVGVYVTRKMGIQHLRVTFPDGSVRTAEIDKDGFSKASVSVPGRFRAGAGTLRIRIDASNAPYTLASIYFE
jgi:hypothetical protein